MARETNDNIMQIYRIAKYYYLDNLSQNEISKIEQISRPQVSRYLKRARELGCVHIDITFPKVINEDYLVQNLKDKYHVEHAVIAPSQQQDDLAKAQSLLDEKESEIAAQKEQLDALSVQLGTQQTQIDEQQSRLDNQQRQIEQLVGMKTRIITSLSDALRSASISASVDPTSGAIALESDVLFSTGQYRLTDEGRARINAFLPVYLNVLFSDEYRPYISEIIIEGHTDSLGGYIQNLELSQQRAGAVAAYVLDETNHVLPSGQLQTLRQLVTANGRSFSDPVLDANGNEDMDASRRVVFKFRLTDEQMIEQLKDILETSD